MRFDHFIRTARAAGRLVVQPRMGFGHINQMQAGLAAVRAARAMTVGTITLDSYTRVGDHESARLSLARGQDLNGFPIVTHGAATTRAMLQDIQGADFPIQVRHGCSLPHDIFLALIAADVDATEGGPISYCLPYGRTPLRKSIDAWARCSDLLAERAGAGQIIHLESFGGCMLGQLCPPSLLIAIAILECMFFQQHGVKSVSLSYAQQTSLAQDRMALAALRRLADERLTGVEWHVVLYTYMGVFPKTEAGALAILAESVHLALDGGADRLIVKTPAEAQRIPTVAENVGALEYAEQVAAQRPPGQRTGRGDDAGDIYQEARGLVDSVLELHSDIGRAMQLAFERGYLDVPYCLHADNAGRTRSYIDASGALRWQNAGSMAVQVRSATTRRDKIKAQAFLQMLSYVEHSYDVPHLHDGQAARAGAAPAPYTIAIVGTGPRGIAVLEHLARGLATMANGPAVRLLVIDDVEVGCGRIWRTGQPAWLMMNTLASQVTMYSGGPDQHPARPGAGPSLYEWLAAQSDPTLPRLDADDYASRQVYGRYLQAVYRSIVAHLPSNVTVQEVKGRVVALAEQDAVLTLWLEDGREFARVNKVVLATGHPKNQLNRSAAFLQQFAAVHPQLTFIGGDSAADMPLDSIADGSAVGVIGMGLGFFDILLSLTVGRGGRFATAGGELRYHASGREPRIVAGSRGGAPIFARGINQKRVGAGYKPLFITPAALRQARVRAAAACGSEQLNFARDVMPLVQAEVEHVYYKTHVQRILGEAWAQKFAVDHEQLVMLGHATDAAFLEKFALADVPAIDLHTLARPFEGRVFASHAAWTAALLELMQADLAEAKCGNVDGALKAAVDVLRDVRDIIRLAVDFGGLELQSYLDDFLGAFAPLCSILAAGPPLLRNEQAIALMRAGILDVIGPNAGFDCDGITGRYRVHSPDVAGATRYVTALIDSRIPTTHVQLDRSALTRNMLDSGFACSYVRDDGREAVFDTGGLAVADSPFHVLDASGQPHLNCYALGIPTEHTRWFTQVGSDTPNAATRFGRDAGAIAADILASLAADLVPALQETGTP